MAEQTEMMPCPFCGQQDAFVEQLDSDASVVICQGRIDEHSACLARGPVGVQESYDEEQPGKDAAVREWNRRAVPPAAEHPDTDCEWCMGTGRLPTDEPCDHCAVRVSRETLQNIHRDLDACQKVIWLAGCRPRGYGFDPAYVSAAQARLKEIEALLGKEERNA